MNERKAHLPVYRTHMTIFWYCCMITVRSSRNNSNKYGILSDTQEIQVDPTLEGRKTAEKTDEKIDGEETKIKQNSKETNL